MVRSKAIEQNNLQKWILTLLAGLTLFYVLFVFRGYGIQTGLSFSGHSLLTRSLLFGLLNSAVFYLFEFQLARYFPASTLLKKGGWILIEFLTGATAVFLLFNYFWNWTEWDWNGYTLLVREYIMVMLIPLLIVYTLSFLNSTNKKTGPELLKFTSENGKELMRIPPEDFLYIKSAGNYIEVYYLLNEQVKKGLLRNSLKAVENTYPDHPQLQRCHRSYLVNPLQIRQILRAKGKTELELGHCRIPLSKIYEDTLHI